MGKKFVQEGSVVSQPRHQNLAEFEKMMPRFVLKWFFLSLTILAAAVPIGWLYFDTQSVVPPEPGTEPERSIIIKSPHLRVGNWDYGSVVAIKADQVEQLPQKILFFNFNPVTRLVITNLEVNMFRFEGETAVRSLAAFAELLQEMPGSKEKRDLGALWSKPMEFKGVQMRFFKGSEGGSNPFLVVQAEKGFVESAPKRIKLI